MDTLSRQRAARTAVLSLWALVAIPISASADFNYDGFTDAGSLMRIMNSVVADGKCFVVCSQPSHYGAVWHRVKEPVQDGFETTFTFRVVDKKKTGCGGFAFVIQNNSIYGLGRPWRHLGYGGLANSLAIEFDTYPDEVNDPKEPHVAIQTTSGMLNWTAHKPPGCLGLSTTPSPFTDGKPHNVVIRYENEIMSVFIDDMVLPLLLARVNLPELLELDEGKAWVGFTGATGSSRQGCAGFEILSWTHRNVPADSEETGDPAAEPPPVPATLPARSSFSGTMAYIQLGDPLEDRQQLDYLTRRLKRYPNDSGVFLWADSPGGEAGLVQKMADALMAFSGPKILLVGGGRYSGFGGEVVRLCPAFDYTVTCPGAFIGRCCLQPPGENDFLLPSTSVSLKRAAAWADASLDIPRVPYTLNAELPEEAIECCFENPEEVQLTPPIILLSRLDAKLSEATENLSLLKQELPFTIADARFWASYAKSTDPASRKRLKGMLDDYIDSALRCIQTIQRLDSLLEKTPEVAGHVTAQGEVKKEWDEQNTVALSCYEWTYERSKLGHPTAGRAARGKAEQTSFQQKISVNLYYGCDRAKLGETQNWLQNAVDSYRKLRRQL